MTTTRQTAADMPMVDPPGQGGLRLAVYGHALIQEAHQARWQRLASRHGAVVTAVVPAAWETAWFGSVRTVRPTAREEDSFRVVPLPVWDRRRWGLYGFCSLDAGLRQARPQVIITYGEETSLLLQQIILLRALWAPRARLAFFSWNNLGVFHGRRRALKSLLWRRVCRCTDLALAGNSDTAALLAAAGYRRRIVVQTELGVDEACFRPDPRLRQEARQALGLEGFVIGFAGRLTAAKGVEDLLAAARLLNPRSTLLMVGDGDLRTALTSAAQDARLTVRWVGEAPVETMPYHLRAMDCLVLPSRTTPTWKEQFGLVLAQAMACGVPVIGSASGAIPEVIADAGLVVPERDPAALADAIAALRQAPERAAAITECGRCRVREHYGVDALADQTYRLCQEMLAEGARGRP